MDARQKRELASHYRGVTYTTRRGGCYQAVIRHEGRLRWLGYYPDPETAARVYDVAADILHGENAQLNFDGQPPTLVPRALIERRLRYTKED